MKRCAVGATNRLRQARSPERFHPLKRTVPWQSCLIINLPDGSGLDALRDLKAKAPQAVVIMITANVLVEDTIAALRGGAYDFIGKPINLNELQVTIRNGLEASKLRREVSRMRREQKNEFNFDQIIGPIPCYAKDDCARAARCRERSLFGAVARRKWHR